MRKKIKSIPLDAYVLVELKIEHPRFGYLTINKFQRKQAEMETLYKEYIEEKSRYDTTCFFKYDSNILTVIKLQYFDREIIDKDTIMLEFYQVIVDWTGY